MNSDPNFDELEPRGERESSQDSLEIIDLDALEAVKLDDATW